MNKFRIGNRVRFFESGPVITHSTIEEPRNYALIGVLPGDIATVKSCEDDSLILSHSNGTFSTWSPQDENPFKLVVDENILAVSPEVSAALNRYKAQLPRWKSQ